MKATKASRTKALSNAFGAMIYLQDHYPDLSLECMFFRRALSLYVYSIDIIYDMEAISAELDNLLNEDAEKTVSMKEVKIESYLRIRWEIPNEQSEEERS